MRLPHFWTLLTAALTLLACETPTASAQDADEVPAAVLASMRRTYPEARDVEWDVDRNDNYEAHFELGRRKLRADFAPDGTWIETEESIKWKHLPEAVQEAVKAEYDKDDIEELEHTVSRTKGDFYDVEIDPKGEKKFDVEYRADGTKMRVE